jgi:hypothetical protein
MKKIIILMLLSLFVSVNVYSMQACRCPCGNRESTLLDHLKILGAFSGFVSSPAYMNHMLYRDNNMTGLYIYDGLILGFAAAALVSGDMFEGEVREASVMALGFASTVVVWGYSCISLVNGIIQDDGEKTGRGAIGVFASPVIFIASFMLTLDCRCRPENDCLAVSPAIGPNYAGLNCNFKF